MWIEDGERRNAKRRHQFMISSFVSWMVKCRALHNACEAQHEIHSLQRRAKRMRSASRLGNGYFVKTEQRFDRGDPFIILPRRHLREKKKRDFN